MRNAPVLLDNAITTGDPAREASGPDPKSADRRKASRYPVHQELRYRVIHREDHRAGFGGTIDLSSSGIFFWSREEIPLGSFLEVSVNWPVLLDGSCALKLVVQGPVVRVDGGRVAVRIVRHEFRTRSSRV